jgi:hypothetical protein
VAEAARNSLSQFEAAKAKASTEHQSTQQHLSALKLQYHALQRELQAMSAPPPPKQPTTAMASHYAGGFMAPQTMFMTPTMRMS